MLVKRTCATQKSAVINCYVTAEQAVVGDDDVVADDAVVPQMSSDHQEILVSDLGRGSVGCSAVNGAIFPNHVVIADLHTRLSVRIKGQILRDRANYRSVTNKVSRA